MNNQPDSRVEMQLLIACCQRVLGEYEAEDFLALFSQTFDEQLFVSFCEAHRLLLVMFETLIIPFQARLPQAFVALVSEKAAKIKIKQLAIEQMLFQISAAFNEQLIAHVVLKGPPLNQLLFGNKTLRYARDLDVLILPKDALKANEILQTFGFQPRISPKMITWHSHFRYISSRKDVIYDRPNTHFTIELHWKTHEIELLFMQPNKWLDQRLLYPYKQHAISILSHEYHCLYLCCHAIKHKWERLRWLFDIVLFIQLHQLDCNQLLALANNNQLTNALLETFIKIKQQFGIDYIAQLHDAPTVSRLKKVARALEYRCNPVPENSSKLKKLQRLYYLNQFSTNYRYQLRYWCPVYFRIIKKRLKVSWKEK